MAIDGILLPNPNAELSTVPTRSYQTTCSVPARSALLLESIDRDVRCVVPIR